jgi:hypothetical protein
MLDLNQKIKIFEELLELDNSNYAEEMYIYFFTLEQGDFDFLNKLASLEEIDKRVKFVLAKIAKHEHEDCISNIIENYIN